MTLDQYKAALNKHDWYYMYADSSKEFSKGKEQWLALSAMQRKLDPDYVIFNQYAPDDMKIDPATLPGAVK